MFLFLVNFFLLDKSSLDYVELNKSNFQKNHNIKKKDCQILIEFNNWKPFHVSNSYLLNFLIKKYNANAIGYEIYRNLFFKKNFFENIKWFIGSLLYLKTFYIYKSFNVNKFIYPKFDKKIKSLVDKIYLKKLKNIKNKKDLERIEINNIWIGDIFYDSFLKKFNLTTIDINSNSFKIYFKEFLYIFYFWQNYFKKNKVKAVLSSHGVYTFAIPLRIAAYKNIDAFVTNEQKIYRYKKNNISQKRNLTGNFSESRYFKQIFLSFSKRKQLKVIKEGQQISKNLAHKSKKLFYLNKEKIKNFKNIKSNLLPKKKSVRVLISSHAFLDSPHVYGKNLFVDFEEWFNFLNKIIRSTTYEWFIKPHPNKDTISNNSINNFLRKNKRVKLIDSNYNINHLAKMNIDFVLTIFGVVAREYPLRKINVINASAVNPHRFFNFSYTCKNLKKYSDILLNLNKFKYKPNKKDLYIYHYMNDKFFNRNYLFKDFDNEVLKTGGIKNFYNENFYNRWVYNKKKTNHKIINSYIENFVKSEDYALSLKHQNLNNEN